MLPSEKNCVQIFGLKHIKMKGFFAIDGSFLVRDFFFLSFISFMREITKFCYLNNYFSKITCKYGNLS